MTKTFENESINIVYSMCKIFFYTFISTYSFYKIYTNDFILNDAYKNPIKYYFFLDVIPYVYNKNYIHIFHHITGMFFFNYNPINLHRFYNKVIVYSLSTEVSNIFLKLIHLKINTKLIKSIFFITFLYRFYILHKFQVVLTEEKDTFVKHDYNILYKIIWFLYVLFWVMHVYWLSQIIKSLKKRMTH
jgi:hypothetical protein